jgi:glycosyltransferase involved in cell wall biosynthesis
MVDRIDVIAQSVGAADLPANVVIHSLGKERGASKFAQAFRLLRLGVILVPRADRVLVLMVPFYVVALWPFAFFWRKPLFLWYTHKHVSRLLRFAERLVTEIYSASRESFRLPTDKVRFLGHAIDTELFHPGEKPRDQDLFITVGRIAAVKRVELLIEAIAILRGKGRHARLEIIGEPILSADRTYYDRIQRMVQERGYTSFVSFVGAKSPEAVAERYRQASVCLNASETGSLDKAILEAMASGCPCVTTNEAFRDILPEGYVHVGTAEAFADRMASILSKPHDQAILRSRVLQRHDMKTTLKSLIDFIFAAN